MCGACRVTVGDEVKFACVDGPKFDGHLVDLDQAMKRQQMYKTQEGRDLLKAQEAQTHHGGCGHCGGDDRRRMNRFPIKEQEPKGQVQTLKKSSGI